jgi:hypothetical protein
MGLNHASQSQEQPSGAASVFRGLDGSLGQGDAATGEINALLTPPGPFASEEPRPTSGNARDFEGAGGMPRALSEWLAVLRSILLIKFPLATGAWSPGEEAAIPP